MKRSGRLRRKKYHSRVPSAGIGLFVGRAPTALAAAALFSIFLLTASRSTLWDRDEPRFGEAAAEMAESGNYLFPTFNGRLRPDKPILTYWLMSASIRLFGRNEVAVRLWSCLASAGSALAAAAMARALFASRDGLWAAMILCTSPLVMLEAGAATADALLLLFTALAMLAFVRSSAASQELAGGAALAGAFALALFTKGPVGLMPLLSIAATLALAKGEIPSRGRRLRTAFFCALLAAMLFLVWFLPADRATIGRFWSEGFGQHVIARSLHPREGHGAAFFAGLPYYVPVILAGFSPWTLFLPGAVCAVAGGRVGHGRGRAILAGWTLAPLAVFSLVSTKLPHYILPIFPALALAVAGTLEADRRGELTPRDRIWLRRGVWLSGTVSAAEIALLLAGFWIAPPELRRSAVMLGAIIAAFSAAAITAQLATRFRRAAVIAFSGAMTAQLAAAFWILPALESQKPVPPVARKIRAGISGPTPVATFEFAEPSLDFYLGLPPIERLAAGDVSRWASSPQPGVLVTTREALLRLPTGERLGLPILAERRGFNYSKGRWIDLVAFERGRPSRGASP